MLVRQLVFGAEFMQDAYQGPGSFHPALLRGQFASFGKPFPLPSSREEIVGINRLRLFPHQAKNPLPKDGAQLPRGYLEATRQYISLLVKANRGPLWKTSRRFAAAGLEDLSFWIRKRESWKRRSPGVLETLPRLLVSNLCKRSKHEYSRSYPL